MVVVFTFQKNSGCGLVVVTSLVMTLILWYNCGRTVNWGDFGRKIVFWLGCGVFVENLSWVCGCGVLF